jgi:glutaconyl-CoA/methylmalonyl-CoA decarboxylase subunit gamma
VAVARSRVACVKITAQVGSRAIEIDVEREGALFRVAVDGETHVVDARKLEGDFYSLLTSGRSYEVTVEYRADAYHVRHGAAEQIVRLTDPGRKAREAAQASGPERILTLMPGKVVRVLVAPGEAVEPGQGVAVVEAMKMENEIATTRAGKVQSVEVRPGQSVEGGTVLAVIE